MKIYEIILQQLGANKFIAMTGAKDFIGDEKRGTLIFTLPKNMSKANRVTVRYNGGRDDYTMTFWRITASRGDWYLNGRDPYTMKTIKEVDGLYANDLQKTFTEVTGMYTYL